MKPRKSQIAVIITFVIVVILLFIAVFINLAKVSQVKTLTGTASDKAALSLASQLGSMGHYYKEKVLGGSVEPPCTTDWKSLVTLIIIAAVTGILSFFFPPALLLPTLIGGATAGAISTIMLTGISQKFKEMTGYNAIRESTLFQAVGSMQSDDVELKVKEPGVFYEDSNGNGIFDIGERVYNLSAMPGMLHQPKVDRFSAWYYTNRLALERREEQEVKDDLDKFIDGGKNLDGSLTALRDGLKDFIDIDDSTLWGDAEALSYLLVPGGSSERNYDVTCVSPACPDWVKDVATEQLRMARIDASNVVYGGFLSEKLISLLNRLEASYNLSFCNILGCSEVDNLIIDLGQFLRRTKETINLSPSQRMNNLTQWFLAFYDFKEHKADRTSIHDTAPTPNDDLNLDADYSYDIYLRLIRDQVYINRWIRELETLNTNTIAPDIRKKHGECTWGRGPGVASECASAYGCDPTNCGEHCCGPCDCECCVHCCNTCCWFVTNRVSPCAWEGTYYTCDQDPPVCSNRDLYGARPDWCSSHADHAGCDSHCGCSVQTFNDDDEAKNFQGQLSWRTPADGQFDGTAQPTEVEQAITILRALDDDIAKIGMVIADLADRVEYLTTTASVSPFRNEIVYAWKDKHQFSHLVQVKIEGYPEKLPYVTESIEWGGLQKCRKLNNYAGNFTIATSRYDQDQPTAIAEWQLRRRKQPKQPEFDATRLNAIVEDIQDNGTINTTQADVTDILNHYAITSATAAHYGTEKSDIKITATEGD